MRPASSYLPEEDMKILHEMHRCMEEMEKSSFYLKFLEQIKSPDVLNNVLTVAKADPHSQLQMVIYGIGSIAQSEDARLQLSLALLLRGKFRWVGEIEVYDPIMSSSECRVIEELGCRALHVNEEGRRSVERPTLFYMPYCPRPLYENLLEANWSTVNLKRIVLLANSFAYTLKRVSKPHGRLTEPCGFGHLVTIQKHALEFRIATDTQESLCRPFGNISWHFFALDALPHVDL